MNHDENVEMRLFELLADRPKHVSELAIELRRLVSKLAGKSSELLYKTYAVSNVFTFSGKLGQAFIHIATYSEHVNLGFNQGTRLEDPDGILEGSGKLIRHIRIDSIAAAKKNHVKKLIRAAIELGRKMAEDAGAETAQVFVDKAAK